MRRLSQRDNGMQRVAQPGNAYFSATPGASTRPLFQRTPQQAPQQAAPVAVTPEGKNNQEQLAMERRIEDAQMAADKAYATRVKNVGQGQVAQTQVAQDTNALQNVARNPQADANARAAAETAQKKGEDPNQAYWTQIQEILKQLQQQQAQMAQQQQLLTMDPRVRAQGLQQALNQAGARLRVDGVIGPRTRAAMQQFPQVAAQWGYGQAQPLQAQPSQMAQRQPAAPGTAKPAASAPPATATAEQQAQLASI